MNDDIRRLIEALRRGDYQDPAERIGLLTAALKESPSDLGLLLDLLRAPQAPLRLAALGACRGRTEAPLVTAMLSLATDTEVPVRERVAEWLGPLEPNSAIRQALHQLLDDPDGDVREAAVRAVMKKPDFLPVVRTVLRHDSDWEVRAAAALAVGEHPSSTVLPALFGALAEDSDDDVHRNCGAHLERRLPELMEPASQPAVDIGTLIKAEQNLRALGGARFPKLIDWMASLTRVRVDPAVLAGYGTDLTALAERGVLPHAHGFDHLCETLLGLLQREPVRSLVLLGGAGTGKSALVQELAHRLRLPENGEWHVLRVSPSDFMSGTRYLGDWETKVKELVENVRRPRRVLLFVPNLSDLSAAGRWSKSDSNVATALAPYIEEGAIQIIGESTPEEYERGLGSIPMLSRLFDRVQMQEASLETTLDILSCLSEEMGSPAEETVLRHITELGAQYLSHMSRPGNAVSLLRSAMTSRADERAPVTERLVLDALSRSTGLPADLLDDARPLSLESVRAFFDKRVLGQPEAVQTVVNLVALIKAGLTDPNKPFGVFTFIGPTGVGKTELARALAEFIFGDVGRLKRFDMSEYASPQGYERLIGDRNENGTLTDAVRQQPFSVVLLDEIEKSHINVFDEQDEEGQDLVYLQVSGLGAHALLKHEAGLHALARKRRFRDEKSGREKTREDREMIRVRLFSLATEPDPRFVKESESKVRPLNPPSSRILRKAGFAVHAFHPPTVTALDVWLGGDRQEAVSHAMTILHAEAMARVSGEVEADAVIVRQYQFGLGTKVRDLRTGRTTTKVDKVLQGRLDLFF